MKDFVLEYHLLFLDNSNCIIKDIKANGTTLVSVKNVDEALYAVQEVAEKACDKFHHPACIIILDCVLCNDNPMSRRYVVRRIQLNPKLMGRYVKACYLDR